MEECFSNEMVCGDSGAREGRVGWMVGWWRDEKRNEGRESAVFPLAV